MINPLHGSINKSINFIYVCNLANTNIDCMVIYIELIDTPKCHFIILFNYMWLLSYLITFYFQSTQPSEERKRFEIGRVSNRLDV